MGSVPQRLNHVTEPNPVFDYLVLGFDERGYGVISRQAVNHLLPYLRKRKGVSLGPSRPPPEVGSPTSTLMSFSSSASRKSSVTGSLNLAVCREAREFAG